MSGATRYAENMSVSLDLARHVGGGTVWTRTTFDHETGKAVTVIIDAADIRIDPDAASFPAPPEPSSGT